MRRRGAVAAVATAVLVAAGCGDTEIDTERAEDEIARAIAAQTGIALESVDCPDDVKAEANGRFQCTARGVNGATATIEVVQTDDEGNIRFSAPDLSGLGGGGPPPTGTPAPPPGTPEAAPPEGEAPPPEGEAPAPEGDAPPETEAQPEGEAP